MSGCRIFCLSEPVLFCLVGLFVSLKTSLPAFGPRTCSFHGVPWQNHTSKHGSSREVPPHPPGRPERGGLCQGLHWRSSSVGYGEDLSHGLLLGRPGRALQIQDAVLDPRGVAGGLHQPGSAFERLSFQGGGSCRVRSRCSSQADSKRAGFPTDVMVSSVVCSQSSQGGIRPQVLRSGRVRWYSSRGSDVRSRCSRGGGVRSQASRSGGVRSQASRGGGVRSQASRSGGVRSQASRSGGVRSQASRGGGVRSQASRGGGGPLTGLPKRRCPLTGLSKRRCPLTGLPRRRCPLTGLPKRRCPLTGLPKRRCPLTGLPRWRCPLTGLSKRRCPLTFLPRRRCPLTFLPRRRCPLTVFRRRRCLLTVFPRRRCSLPRRRCTLTILPRRRCPLSGLPGRLRPLTMLPKRRCPLTGLPKRRCPLTGLPKRQCPLTGLPRQRCPLTVPSRRWSLLRFPTLMCPPKRRSPSLPASGWQLHTHRCGARWFCHGPPSRRLCLSPQVPLQHTDLAPHPSPCPAVPLVRDWGTSGIRSLEGGLCQESGPCVSPSRHQRSLSPGLHSPNSTHLALVTPSAVSHLSWTI